jgi:acylglycerol lipase
MLSHFNDRRFFFRANKLPVICLVLLLFALIFYLVVGNHLFENLPNKNVNLPRLDNNIFVTSDNARLPFRSWLPDIIPVKAAIIALHGFNDYSHFFTEPGNYFKRFGIASYAYDQRGFGNTQERGSWAKTNVYTRDVAEFTQLVRNLHPGVPIYLLGESMGAAEIIVAMTSDQAPVVDGVILSAPAVWAWRFVPWYQRFGLWLASQTVPWLQLNGAGLHLVPSDNIKMLHELSHDPLILKKIRIGTIYGLADLMNSAFEHAPQLDKLTLVLYGEHDEIVPKRVVYPILKALPPNRKWSVALYENAYHMLLRDLEAPKYWRDIIAWIRRPQQNLPSTANIRAATVFCGKDMYKTDGLVTLSCLNEEKMSNPDL